MGNTVKHCLERKNKGLGVYLLAPNSDRHANNTNIIKPRWNNPLEVAL